MKIEGIKTAAELTEIVAGLVREGVTFVAKKCGNEWEIELTGGC